jgi:hypothetical protein
VPKEWNLKNPEICAFITTNIWFTVHAPFKC